MKVYYICKECKKLHLLGESHKEWLERRGSICDYLGELVRAVKRLWKKRVKRADK